MKPEFPLSIFFLLEWIIYLVKSKWAYISQLKYLFSEVEIYTDIYLTKCKYTNICLDN